MTRFELATPRPPDAYSNLAELHPDFKSVAKLLSFFQSAKFFGGFLHFCWFGVKNLGRGGNIWGDLTFEKWGLLFLRDEVSSSNSKLSAEVFC